MMKRIKGSLFCLGLRKNSGFLSWKGSSLIAARQKGFSLSAEAAVGAVLMAMAWASPARSLCHGAWGSTSRVKGSSSGRLSAGLGNSSVPSWGFALVGRVEGGTGQCKACFHGTRALYRHLACPDLGNSCCCASSSTHCPARILFFFNQTQGKMNGKQLSTLPLPLQFICTSWHIHPLYMFLQYLLYISGSSH